MTARIALPITVSPQSKHHTVLHDASGAYLATTRADLVEVVKAAFEAAGVATVANRTTDQ